MFVSSRGQSHLTLSFIVFSSSPSLPQTDLLSCLSSSSFPRKGSWFSTAIVCPYSAPPLTWMSRWNCNGTTMAGSQPHRRSGASTWRRPCSTTAACSPGTVGRSRGQSRETNKNIKTGTVEPNMAAHSLTGVTQVKYTFGFWLSSVSCSPLRHGTVVSLPIMSLQLMECTGMHKDPRHSRCDAVISHWNKLGWGFLGFYIF